MKPTSKVLKKINKYKKVRHNKFNSIYNFGAQLDEEQIKLNECDLAIMYKHYEAEDLKEIIFEFILTRTGFIRFRRDMSTITRMNFFGKS